MTRLVPDEDVVDYGIGSFEQQSAAQHRLDRGEPGTTVIDEPDVWIDWNEVWPQRNGSMTAVAFCVLCTLTGGLAGAAIRLGVTGSVELGYLFAIAAIGSMVTAGAAYSMVLGRSE